ncbi:MAG: tRNA (adenosine(37)-N6)-threonylcarbamoyltransferase complex dimerization subunit type 1 TsaB [Candidatus Acidiferrales bacterium]
MRLLAVDTSSRDASVAVFVDDRVAALVAPRGNEQHSVALFRSIEQALSQAGMSLNELEAYAVTTGPGAFTALRVGLSVIKALAEVSGKPVAAVSALEAVCESAQASGLLVPMVDAYRGQVFGGVYEKRNGDVVRRGRERVMSPEEFLASLVEENVQAAGCTLIGPHLERWATHIAESPFSRSRREITSPVLAEAVGRRARRRLARGEGVDALHLEANYVRRSDAELLWKEK